MKHFTKQEVEEIENLWAERHNALVRTLVAYCKKIQEDELKISKDILHPWRSPVINALDNVILELMKHNKNI